jgi:hypothetical protein
MPLISSSIPNLINGVSQQPAALRLASQCEQMVNCMASPVEGLRKRPPAQHIAKLFNGSAGAGRPFTTIVDRDGAIKYLVLIQDNAIKVFGLDGSVKTVSTPDGTSYLDITGEPSSTFRVASVADYTFIVNREKTVAMSGTTSPTWGTKGMVFIRSAEYGTTYSITVNSTTVSYTTLPAGGKRMAASYSRSGSTVTVTAIAHGLATGNQVDMTIVNGNGNSGTYTITVTGADTFTYTDTSSGTTSGTCTVVYQPNYSPSTVEIAAGLKAALSAALSMVSWTITNGAGQYIVRITKVDGADYTLSSTDTKTGLATVAVKGTIDSISDLPVTAEHGFIVEITGAAATGADDYYVKFVANAGSGFGHGVWQETVAPGIPYLFDATTMPHVLIRNNDGTFTFQKFTWAGRVAGDATTAPNPSFVGSQIQNINLFRNRLVLLADENVITSAADSYDRFWPESAQTIVDSDPIDLSAGSRKVNFLMASVAFSNVLLLFSRHGQFRLDSGSSLGQTLTPKTASVTQVTAFEMGDVVDPVIVGRTMYFAVPRGDFSGLREFFLPDASGPVPTSEEVTSSVPRFLPGNLCNLVATAAEEAAYVVSKDQPTRLYGYKFLFEGDKKLQSAWGYWETNGGKSIIGIDMVDSDLYLVVQYSNGVYLEKVVTRPESVDAGTQVELLLDRKATEASCTVALTTPSGLDTQSTITLPYPIDTANAQMAVVGRLFAGNSLMHGQSVQIISSTAAGGAGGMGTLTVRGDLTAAKFYVGETYDMLYEFSAQFLKEQPPGGGMAVIAGPKLQLRTWTVVFDKSSAFNLQVTPRGRDTMTYPYTGFEIGDQEVALGELALRTSKFRVPVMAQNIEAKVEITSSSPLPCRIQSAEWEGWYHTRSARL